MDKVLEVKLLRARLRVLLAKAALYDLLMEQAGKPSLAAAGLFEESVEALGRIAETAVDEARTSIDAETAIEIVSLDLDHLHSDTWNKVIHRRFPGL